MLNIKKSLQEKLSATSYQLPASRNLPPTTYNLKSSRGFTLIELLVVSAIIGVLVSIVGVSLFVTKSKGADAGIKSNLVSMMTQAELTSTINGGFYGSVSFPVGSCSATLPGSLFAEPMVSKQIIAAGNASNGGGIGRASCVSTSLAWAVSVPLNTTADDSWCVDSKGKSKMVTPSGGDRGFSGVACK